MKKTILFWLIATLCITAACKRPEGEAKRQQKIETPPVQMSEPVAPTPEMLKAAGAPAPSGVEGPPAQPTTQTVVKSATNIEIIVDASGSMNGLLGQTTKINALRTSLRDVLSTPLPPELAKRKLSLRVFGSQSPSDKNDCKDTLLLAPMGKEGAPGLIKVLEGVTPQGTTPLAFSLIEAFSDFTESAETADNLAILVVDGPETCGGDIMAAAERLHEGPSRVIVDVIGFDVDQDTQKSLQTMAESTDGHFYLARTEAELYSALDQAISATLPYNLRVKVMSGATPLPSTITVFRANTQSIVERAETQGVKFFKLLPGSYDILVRYDASIEETKPSKMIKGVEVAATAKAEQIVQFDLGTLNLSAVDQAGTETVSNFYFRKSGSDEIIGRLTAVQPPQMVFLSPGMYDIDAESASPETATLSAQAKGLEIKTGETIEKQFKFQTGKLAIKGQTVDKKFVPIKYRITPPNSEETAAEGTATEEGGTIDLPPGTYDVYVTWVNPNVEGGPETKLPNLLITGGETLEQIATIVAGTLKLSGKDSAGRFVYTEFSLKKSGEEKEAVKVIIESEPEDIFVAPGTYDILATNTTSKVSPQPTVAWKGINVKEAQSQTLEALFQLGTLKLIGKNAKEQIIPSSFTIFRGGMDEPIIIEESKRDWVTLALTPGLYDVKAEDTLAQTDPKPATWLHDVEVTAGKEVAKEAIFTSGKLKLICRGVNNILLTCEFNLFAYGSDTALFQGTTTDDWKLFDIPPGNYYLEAGWHDPVGEQLLKKWINVSIGENKIVEMVIRF